MPYCSDCGKRVDAQVFYCPACGGPMQFAAPAAKPGAYTQQDQAAFTPAPYDSEVDEQYLDGYSWAPGCGFYFYSRALLVFVLIIVVLEIISAFFLVPPTDPGSGNEKVGLGQALISLLFSLSAIGIVAWVGKIARRRRWTMLRWRDFEHFRRDENSWNTAGIIGWIFAAVSFVISFFANLPQS